MLGLVKTAVAGFLIAIVFRDRIVKSQQREADAGEIRLTRQGWLVVIVLGIALLLWITDFLHGIAPAWVALIAAIIFMFPGVDIVPLDQFNKLVNLRPLIYVGGILGLGAFIAASGLGVWIAHYLVSAVWPRKSWRDERDGTAFDALGSCRPPGDPWRDGRADAVPGARTRNRVRTERRRRHRHDRNRLLDPVAALSGPAGGRGLSNGGDVTPRGDLVDFMDRAGHRGRLGTLPIAVAARHGPGASVPMPRAHGTKPEAGLKFYFCNFER